MFENRFIDDEEEFYEKDLGSIVKFICAFIMIKFIKLIYYF